MKKVFNIKPSKLFCVLLGTLSLNLGCNNTNRKIRFKDKNGNVIQEGYQNMSGKMDGVLINYYENGAIKSKIRFENGLQQGPSFFYDKEGRLESVTNFKDSKMEGQETHYYENGKVKWIKHYLNNKLIDHDTAFWPKGQIQFISDFDQNGERMAMNYYDVNGKRDLFCIYGKKHQAYYKVVKYGQLIPILFSKHVSTKDTARSFLSFEDGKFEYGGKLDYLSKEDSATIDRYYPDWHHKLKEVSPRPVKGFE